jgi:hypothetical protein
MKLRENDTVQISFFELLKVMISQNLFFLCSFFFLK